VAYSPAGKDYAEDIVRMRYQETTNENKLRKLSAVEFV
jgi:hypothetical protein